MKGKREKVFLIVTKQYLCALLEQLVLKRDGDMMMVLVMVVMVMMVMVMMVMVMMVMVMMVVMIMVVMATAPAHRRALRTSGPATRRKCYNLVWLQKYD